MPYPQPQLVPMPLGGLAQKKPPAWYPLGRLKTLENGRLKREGEVRKRNGFTSLSTSTTAGGTITDGRRLDQLDNELMLSSRERFYSWVDERSKWEDRGVSARFSIDVKPLIDVGEGRTAGGVLEFGVSNATAAYGNGMIMVIFSIAGTGGGAGLTMRYAVVDASTGEYIVPPTDPSATIGTGVGRRVIYASGKFYAFTTTGGGFRCHTFDTSTFTWSTNTTIDALSIHNNIADVKLLSNGTFLAAYKITAANDLRLINFNTSLAVITARTEATVSNDKCVAILEATETTTAYVAIADAAAGLHVLDVTISTLAVAADNTVDAAAVDVRQMTGWFSGSTRTILYTIHAAATYNELTKKGTYTGAATVTDFKRSVGLYSKAFKVGSKYHVLMAHESDLQPTYFIVDEDGNVTGRLMHGYGGGLRVSISELSHVAAESSTKFHFAVERKIRTDWKRAQRAWATSDDGLALITVDDNDVTMGIGTQGNSLLHMPGAGPQVYDGAQISEYCATLFPENMTAAVGAGGTVTTGDYQFTVVYSWTDDRGLWHRSAPHVPVSASTTAGNNTVTLTIPTLRITSRLETAVPVNSVTIEVYMTNTNLTTFYKKGTVASDPTADTVSFVASNLTGLTTSEILYTDGDALENFPPPACRQMVLFDNRIWAIGCENKNEVWPTKQLRAGNGPGWNPDLALTVDSADGGVFCGIAMDTSLVLFARAAIYVIAGTGPNDLGQGEYVGPTLVTTRVGSRNPRSLALTPIGAFFQSDKGIYLLTRGLEAVYIGADVEDYNSLTITGTVVNPKDDEVRFFTSDGTTLIYNWFHQQWGVDTSQAAVAAIAWKRETTVYLTSGGVAKKEVDGQYNDDGSAIITKVRTGPLQLAQLAGFQRIWKAHLKGEWKGNHTLTANIYVDDGTSADMTITKAITIGRYQYEIPFKTQLCSTAEIELIDSFPGGATQGAYWAGITLEVGVHGRVARMASTARLT